jgi:hypothetical protein
LTPSCVQPVVSSRITIPFGKLFASARYVDEPLLTLTPLYSDCSFLARLACLNPAASVRSEPGSNSSKVFVWFSLSYARRRRTSSLSEDRKRFWMDPFAWVLKPVPKDRFPSSLLHSCCVVKDTRISPVFPRFPGVFSTPGSRVGGALCEAHHLCQTGTFTPAGQGAK